jgi:hypothetical protein
MVDWLRPHFDEENELVDLFYAITNGHGWIKSTRTVVTVRLEPLQQPRRRLAQEQLLRKQTLEHALLAGSGWPLKELRSQLPECPKLCLQLGVIDTVLELHDKT